MKKFSKLMALAFIISALAVMLILTASAKEVAKGTFANDSYPDATWTYSLDSDGTLTIGGTGSNGYTQFTYGASWESEKKALQPWNGTGKINGTEIKKVIIPDSTGITELGNYSLGYLPYMETLEIPSTLKTLKNAFADSKKLGCVYICGNDPVDNYIDFSNITSIGSYLSEGGSEGLDLTVELNKNLSPSATSYTWFKWFKKANSLNFKLYRGSAAHTKLLLLAENQNNEETRDATHPATITFEFIAAYSGTFANEYHTNATWKWALEDDGTLNIYGASADNRTDFYYGGDWDKKAVGSDVPKSNITFLGLQQCKPAQISPSAISLKR